jgi:hypothetical protein
MRSKGRYIAHILIVNTLLAIKKGQYHTSKDQKYILADQPLVFLETEQKVSEMLYTLYRVECGLLGCLRGVSEIGIKADMSSEE